jgi:hypothetical protein
MSDARFGASQSSGALRARRFLTPRCSQVIDRL